MRLFSHTFAACLIICPVLATASTAGQYDGSNLYKPSTDQPIVVVVPDKASALEQYAIEEPNTHVGKLTGPKDSYSNNRYSREEHVHWHDLGPKYSTYLRPFRLHLKSKAPPSEEIGGVFHIFRLAAERGVLSHGFCYRFYGGKYGSFKVHQDDEMRKKYPDRQGPFTLAFLGEASFDPLVEGEARVRKLRRIRKLTIPDYPLGKRKWTDVDLENLQ